MDRSKLIQSGKGMKNGLILKRAHEQINSTRALGYSSEMKTVNCKQDC